MKVHFIYHYSGQVKLGYEKLIISGIYESKYLITNMDKYFEFIKEVANIDTLKDRVKAEDIIITSLSFLNELEVDD